MTNDKCPHTEQFGRRCLILVRWNHMDSLSILPETGRCLQLCVRQMSTEKCKYKVVWWVAASMGTAPGDVTLVSDDICPKEDTDHSTTSDGMNYELNASWLQEYCVSPTQDLWFGPGQHPGLSMERLLWCYYCLWWWSDSGTPLLVAPLPWSMGIIRLLFLSSFTVSC